MTPLERARADLDSLTGLHEGLQDGTRFWWEWNDSYRCPERTTAAIEETWSALRLAQEELARLTGGAR